MYKRQPLVKGDVVGKLVLDLPSKSNSYELLVGESVEELGLFERIGAALKYLIFGAGADVLANS